MRTPAPIHRTSRRRITCIHLRICKLVIESTISVTSNFGLLVTGQGEGTFHLEDVASAQECAYGIAFPNPSIGRAIHQPVAADCVYEGRGMLLDDDRMVGAEGFEPPTLCSQSRCATRLRYAPTSVDCIARMPCISALRAVPHHLPAWDSSSLTTIHVSTISGKANTAKSAAASVARNAQSFQV
jgi:hypothetical protein